MAGSRLPPGMEFFRNAQTVRLRSTHGYLVAEDDEETVALRRDEETAARLRDEETAARWRDEEYAAWLDEETAARWRDEVAARRRDEENAARRRDEETAARARWSVEFVLKSDSVLNSDFVLRLKSCHGKYLAASDKPSRIGMTGCQVLQSLPPLLDSVWEPTMVGNQVTLGTHHRTFLCTGRESDWFYDAVFHDLPHHTTFLWDVEVVVRKEGSATYIDNKASEEGSASNIDDKASASNIEDKAPEKGSAFKRRHETGEGSSVTKSPPGVSAGAIYRSHFWKLKNLLCDDPGGKDVLVKGGPRTTALVREVCADVHEHFGTIAYISIPQNNDPKSICEEILLQLIFERAAFPKHFGSSFWATDDEFPLQQKARCLIVVDNLDDGRTWKKFEEVLRTVKTCRVIFIDRPMKGLPDGQIYQYGREYEIHPLGDLSSVKPAHHMENFLKDGFHSPSKRLCELIFSKCKRLHTAIAFVLLKKKDFWGPHSCEIKDEWEARIPSDLRPELQAIGEVLRSIVGEADGPEVCPIQQGLKILLKDFRLCCLLYLSIFPKDSLISCKRVSRLWAAEGLLTDLGRAENFFTLLLDKQCICPKEKKSDGELSTFQVAERWQEIFVSLSDIHNLVTITSQGSANGLERVRYRSVQGPIWALHEEKEFKLSSTFVDVSSNKDKTATSEALETSETPSFPSKLKHSKVLDLTGAPFQVIPDALCELTNARYLSIRNTSVKVIPDSIEMLTRLEFLDAKHSLVTELPSKVERLKKIRHILIYHHEEDPLTQSYNLIGFKASCSVKGFLDLEKLCFVESDNSILEDLGNLTKLRRLGITKLRKEHGESLCTSLAKLKELKSLNVHALDEDEILNLDYLSSPPESKSRTSPLKSLKRLYLHGRLEKLPAWISSLSNLTKIILRWSQLEEDLLATLGKLQNLIELELRRAYDGSQLDFKNGHFRKLKILLLEELEGLRSVSLEKGTMSYLENLTIGRCQWLERMPSGIEHIRNIQKLIFFDMSHEFCDKVQADHKKDDYQIFKHIPEVYFTRWKAGHWEHYEVESTGEAHYSQQVKGTDEAHCSHQVESTDGINLKMVQADLEEDHRQNFKPKPKVYFTQWRAGLHDHKKQLIKFLLKDKSRRTDVLVRGGPGMRALVRKVCEDVHTRKHFDTIAWITVPQKHDSELISEEILLQVLFENTPLPDDFDTDRGEVKYVTNSSEYNTSELNMGITVPQKHDSELIREEILLQLPFANAPFPDDFDADHREVKYFTNSSEFNKARCLIVVDNLVDPRTQKTFEEVLRLVQTYKVIFMARREMGPWDSLINKYGRRYETYELKDLSVEEPWAHFRLKKSPEGDFRSALKEVCQLVVRKFESLSGAIVLHLRDRKERNGEWTPMILPLDSLPSFNLIQSVLEILSNDDHPLCLLYLSIFPKNSEISCKRISRLWAAEGFLPNQGEAERFISDLLARKCIRPVEERSDGELSTFQVDDLVREIIVSFSDHLDLSRITSEGSTNYPERARYLSVQGGTVKDLNGEKFSQLRSLFMFNVSSNKDKTTMSKASTSKTSENQLFPFNVKGLQVLDLTGAPPQIAPDSPPQIAPNALFESTCLRYLSLRDNSIEVIPDSIERLEHLEFLDLKQSLVTELPKKAEKLKRIRHILIYRHEKDPMMESYNLIGFQASCSVGGFEYLEKLCFVEADKKTLEDLSKLTKLMRLGITKLKEEHGKSLCSSLEKLERLESLNLHAFDKDEMIDLHYLSSLPKNLKRLYLHGRLEKLPNGIISLRHLTKIVLRWSHLEAATQSEEESHLEAATQQEEESHLEAATQQEEDLLTTLGKLDNLVELELRQAYNGRQLDFNGGQFPKLKILLLDELGRLRSMSLAKGTMPCLEDLTISRCQWFERIPMGIEDIATLQALEFFDMSPEFYKMVPDKYRNSEGKPKVYLTQWRPGQWKTIPLVETSVTKASQVYTE